jgi:hypothetical protein
MRAPYGTRGDLALRGGDIHLFDFRRLDVLRFGACGHGMNHANRLMVVRKRASAMV